ncbi:NAD(P)-binding protein [Xylariaceae sp. FL0016]|nr:NAD(P)-binding protein [Xylariaceae sp. FL0016]
MLSLAGKHCIITGGSRGIGLAIASLFASEGAVITLVGRNGDALARAAETLKHRTSSQDHARQHNVHAMDVASSDGWSSLLDATQKKNVDVLVNAAGVAQNSFLFKTTPADIDSLVDINLKGTIRGCHAVIPKMMKQKSGCIINISSLLATHAGKGASIYAASKAGIVGLTRSLAWEVGRFGIRANVLLPGYIQTDMTKDMDAKGQLSATIPIGRLGLANEVAEAAAFLAKNTYAHNCVLNIDGGLSAT